MKIRTTGGDQLGEFVDFTANGVARDMLITELQNRGVLTALKAERAPAVSPDCEPVRLTPGGRKSASATWPR